MNYLFNKDDIHQHLNDLSNKLDLINSDSLGKTEIDFTDLLLKSKVNITEDISEPPVCLEILDTADTSIFGTFGNFSCVIGKAKSRKTFFISIVLAAAIIRNTVLEKVKGIMPEGKNKIILFDTEQSRYHTLKVLRRVFNLAGIESADNFICFNLRSFPADQRINLINHAINTIDGIGLIIIDGIRDLVKDINSPTEASQITGLLMKWTEEKNLHILTVIHQNKGDANARGHLGTELINKAETVISVTKDTKDSSISIVEPEYCREKDFQAFAFKIDEEGIPYTLDNWHASKERKKIFSGFDYPLETHLRILGEIFKRKPSPKYAELWKEIKYSSEEYGIPFGESKAKEFVTFYINRKMIEKVKILGLRYDRYKPLFELV